MLQRTRSLHLIKHKLVGGGVLALMIGWLIYASVGTQPQPVVAAFACPAPVSQIVQTTVASTVYHADVSVNVYLPACYDSVGNPYPVIYLLHGGNADETQWPDLRVQAEADTLIARGTRPFVVVMPGGPYRDTLDYAAFVLNDLLPGIERQFRVETRRPGRAIGGLSLGGYWALKIAFLHPDQFAAVVGNSPAVSRGAADDPLRLARTADNLKGLAIALDVGNLDSLQYGTTLLAHTLQQRGLPVSLAVNPGAHNRAYWRVHTVDYLAFYMAALAPPTDMECLHRRLPNFRC